MRRFLGDFFCFLGARGKPSQRKRSSFLLPLRELVARMGGNPPSGVRGHLERAFCACTQVSTRIGTQKFCRFNFCLYLCHRNQSNFKEYADSYNQGVQVPPEEVLRAC